MYDVALIRATVDLMPLVEPTTTLKKAANICGGEWAGPCPFCGGRDRFVVQPYNTPEGRWLCRNCTQGKWADVIAFFCRLNHTDFKTACERLMGNPLPRAEKLVERRTAEKEEADVRLHEALDILRKAQAWVQYHDNLTAETRNLWRKRGVSDGYQSYWKLGYNPNFRFYSGNEEHHSPTLTIPVFGPGWELQNIRHRLLQPANPGDKYRPERSGIPAAPYVCNPDGKIAGKTLIVEGEIKSMVAYATLDDEHLQAIGIPGKGAVSGLPKLLVDCEPIYICLDPDASDTAYQLARDLGARARVIELPGKVDDIMLAFGLGKSGMEKLMRTAAKVA